MERVLPMDQNLSNGGNTIEKEHSSENILRQNIAQLKSYRNSLEFLLQPFVEMFDDDFKESFATFVESVSGFDISECLTKEGLLLCLMNTIQTRFENESVLAMLKYDCRFLAGKLDEICEEKSKLDNEYEYRLKNSDLADIDCAGKSKDKSFLLKKCEQYVGNIRTMEANLETSGFSENLTVERVVLNQKRLSELGHVSAQLEKQLEAFQGLPPDFDLSETKLNEKRLELEKLEKSLNELVANFHN